MKSLWFIALAGLLLTSCEKEDGLNEGACCRFISVDSSDVSTFLLKYRMEGNAVRSGGEETRNKVSVYSNKTFQLNVLMLGPLDAQDSIVH